MPRLYFAYGSNLDWEQMRARCPSAEFVCVAELKKHRLGFTRWSPSASRRCGVADVLPDEEKSVWGVVYRMHADDFITLDRIEGHDPQQEVKAGAYDRKETVVFENGKNGSTLKVELYQVHNPTQIYPTSTIYKGHLVRGARHWQLPADYIEFLEAIVVEET